MKIIYKINKFNKKIHEQQQAIILRINKQIVRTINYAWT